ncbi:MAG: ABC transporter permease [Candidatus Methanomethylophilaceae archaeon]|nr:ABC transporter permease [Candidatus Methanomethylophilaceae archaeon]
MSEPRTIDLGDVFDESEPVAAPKKKPRLPRRKDGLMERQEPERTQPLEKKEEATGDLFVTFDERGGDAQAEPKKEDVFTDFEEEKVRLAPDPESAHKTIVLDEEPRQAEAQTADVRDAGRRSVIPKVNVGMSSAMQLRIEKANQVLDRVLGKADRHAVSSYSADQGGAALYRMTDEEAHRFTAYHAPDMLQQTWQMFAVQMKLFAKMKWTYFMLVMALMIPITVAVAPGFIEDTLYGFGFTGHFSNVYIAGLLFFMPLFLGLFTSVMCGTSISNEFKDRTAYMNLCLPVSRFSFYFGKFLAGFVMTLAAFMFAYSMAVMTAATKYGNEFFGDLICQSMGLVMIAVFAYSATAFAIGSVMKRGSALVPFVLMSFILPGAIAVLGSATGNWLLTDLPFYLSETALGILGAPVSGSFGYVALPYMDLTEVTAQALAGAIWGIVFLLFGFFRTSRREA